MIFIFDWGHKIESQIGPISKYDVRIADFGLSVTSEFVNLIQVRLWFRMFFIPVIPTEAHYYFYDPERHAQFNISKSDFEKYKPIAKLNNLVIANKISEESYNAERAKIVL